MVSVHVSLDRSEWMFREALPLLKLLHVWLEDERDLRRVADSLGLLLPLTGLLYGFIAPVTNEISLPSS